MFLCFCALPHFGNFLYFRVQFRMVHLKDGTPGEMDSAYIDNQNNIELFERVAVGLEHLSGVLGESKLNMLCNYYAQWL